MRRSNSLLITALILMAVSPMRTRAAANTWNNGSGNSQWDANSANWTGPAVWNNGDDAIFDATGAGVINLSSPIVVANNITFRADGYTLLGDGAVGALLATTNVTVTNCTATLAVSLTNDGVSGMTFQGNGTNLLQGDGTYGNRYTGGTYVRSGTLVLQSFAASYSGLPTGYAVDSIETLDTGATVQFGTQIHQAAPSGQFPYNQGAFPCRLNLTGGTFDLNGDNGNNRTPVPSGTGKIVNSSTYQSGSLVISSYADVTNEFDGAIIDGGDASAAYTNLNNGNFPYRVNVDMHYIGNNTVLILGGSNSYSGSTRIGAGTVQLKNGGTLGNPGYVPGVTGPSRIYGNLDLGGSPLVKLAGFKSISPNAGYGTIYNSAPGTLSVFSFGWGDTGNLAVSDYGYTGGEGANANAFVDNLGTGGRLGLTKAGVNTINFNPAANAGGVNTYSGPTTVLGGVMGFESLGAVSPNTVIYLSGGAISLDYSGTADVQGLVINGMAQPVGTYTSANSPSILGGGALNVLSVPALAARLAFSQSGNNLTLSWSNAAFKLQSQTNSLNGLWVDYPGGGASPITVPLDRVKNSVFFRLAPTF